jgi:hypothetical protein
LIAQLKIHLGDMEVWRNTGQEVDTGQGPDCHVK